VKQITATPATRNNPVWDVVLLSEYSDMGYQYRLTKPSVSSAFNVNRKMGFKNAKISQTRSSVDGCTLPYVVRCQVTWEERETGTETETAWLGNKSTCGIFTRGYRGQKSVLMKTLKVEDVESDFEMLSLDWQ
jgi:hypothetical protein